MSARVMACAAIALALQGCAVAVVQVADGKPRLSAWPLGVRIERSAGDAMSVDSKSVGLVAGCGLLGVGFQHCDQIRIDARSCGVAVIDHPDPASRSLLARIADQARAQCLRETPTKEATP